MNSHAYPGWYPAPDDRKTLRWWDGHRWTDHRSRYPPQTANTPYPLTTQPRPRSTVRNIVLGLLIASLVCGSGWYTWNRHQAHAQWYQDGYALGDKALPLVNIGTSVESACNLAMVGEIPFGSSDFSARKREMERGCAQAVKDRRSA